MSYWVYPLQDYLVDTILKNIDGIFRTFSVAFHGNTGIHFLKGQTYQNMNAEMAFLKKLTQKGFGRKCIHAFAVIF